MSASNSRVQKNLERRSPVPKPIPKSKSFVESMAMEMLLSTRTSPPVTNQALTIAPMIYQASSNIDEERSLRSSRSAASGSSFSSNGSLVDQLQDSITEPELLPAPVIPAKAPKPVSVFSISDFMKNVAPAAAPFVAQHRPSDHSNTSKDLLTTVEDTNEDATVEEPVEENPDEDSWVTDSSGLPPMGSEHSVHSVHSDHLARSEHSDLEHSILSEMPHDGTFPAGNDEYYGEQAEANDSYEDAGADEGQQLVQENEVYSEESDESEENTDGNALEDQLARYISNELFVQELLDNQEAVDVGDSSQSNSMMDVRSTADNVVDDMLHTATLTSALDNPSLTTTTTTTAITTTTATIAADSTVHYNSDPSLTSNNNTSFASYDSTDADNIDPMLVLLNRSESSEFRVENPMRTLPSKSSSLAKQAPIPVPVDADEEQVTPDALLDVLVNVCEPSPLAVSMLPLPVPLPLALPLLPPPDYVGAASTALEQKESTLPEVDTLQKESTRLLLARPADLLAEISPALAAPALEETAQVPLSAVDTISRSRSESPPPPPPPLPLPSITSKTIATHAISTKTVITDQTVVEDSGYSSNVSTLPFPVVPPCTLPTLPSQLLPAQLQCDDNDMVSSDSTLGNSDEQLQYVNMYLPTTSTISADEDPHTSSVMNTVDVNTSTITTTTNSTANITTSPTPSSTTTTTLTPTSSRARGRHLSPGKVRGSILAATATPTMSVPVADSGRVDRYRNKSAIRGTASSSVSGSGSVKSGGGTGGSGGASEGLLSGGSNSKINAGGDVTVTSVSTVMTSPTTNIITPSKVEGLHTLHTAAHAAAAVDASALNAAKHTSLSLYQYQELDMLAQYKSSLLLQTQLVDKIIEHKRALAGDGSQDPQHQLRLQLSIDITSDMLQRSVAESALISSALLGTTGDTNIPRNFDIVVDEGDVQTATAATPARTPSRGGVCRTHSLASAGVSNGSAVNTPARPLTNTYSHGPHAFPLRSHTSSTSTTTTPNATRTRVPSPLTNTLNTASTTGAGAGARADSIRRNSLGHIIPSPLRRASSVNRIALRTPVTKTSTNNTANGAGNVEVITTPAHEPNVSAIHSAATNTNNSIRSIELFPTSPMDTFRRNAAMVNSMLGNIDNYCTCCRTKLVDMDAQKNTRVKHRSCKTCIHRK